MYVHILPNYIAKQQVGILNEEQRKATDPTILWQTPKQLFFMIPLHSHSGIRELLYFFPTAKYFTISSAGTPLALTLKTTILKSALLDELL